MGLTFSDVLVDMYWSSGFRRPVCTGLLVVVAVVPEGVDVCISQILREAHDYGVGLGYESCALSPFGYKAFVIQVTYSSDLRSFRYVCCYPLHFVSNWYRTH